MTHPSHLLSLHELLQVLRSYGLFELYQHVHKHECKQGQYLGKVVPTTKGMPPFKSTRTRLETQ